MSYDSLLSTHRGLRNFVELKNEIENSALPFKDVRIKYSFQPMLIKVNNDVIIAENYYISPYGLVISRCPRNGSDYEVLDYVPDKDFYNRRGFSVNGETHMRNMQQLVALNFLSNPHNYPEVNHIDRDVTNNCVANLEYCTTKQNRDHAMATKKFRIIPKDGVIVQYKMDSNGHLKELRRYNSLRDVPSILPTGETVRGQKNYIRLCCYGCKPQYKGYVWKFATNI